MKIEQPSPSEQLPTLVTLGQEVDGARFEEKKSVFLGHAKSVSTEEEALDFIKAKKKEYSDARHNVWAYRLQGDVVIRCSDDGEPQGSAGIPVLDVLKKTGVTNAVLVVTRYFGGILLGAGGLVRAYSHTAHLAVEAANVVTYEQFSDLEMRCSYAEYERYRQELEAVSATYTDQEFTDRVTLRFSIKKALVSPLRERLTELSGGTVILQNLGEHFGCK